MARSATHRDDLVELLTREQGKARPEQEEEYDWSLTSLRYYAELGRNGSGRVIPSGEPRSQLNLVLKEPYGVVGAIVPWNYPLLLLSWKLAPALAAGNTVVIKPSELTSLTTLAWIERCFDHLPPGVVNVVTGTGAEAGEALVAHPAVQVIAMTGSVATGQRIASVAAPMMKHLHLELGGKDAFVVAPDADLDDRRGRAHVRGAAERRAGVHLGRTRLRARPIGATSSPRRSSPRSRRSGSGTGWTRGPTSARSPPTGSATRSTATSTTRSAAARRWSTGGGRPDRPGWFLEPTVLVDVDDDMAIMTEETFGPTIPIATYGSLDEVIDRINASPMGLGATLRSSDPGSSSGSTSGVKAGTVWINDPLTDNYAGPFGGMKMTGGGRELGPEGLETFLETKHVHWDLPGPQGLVVPVRRGRTAGGEADA